MSQRGISSGLDFANAPDLQTSLSHSLQCHYSFIVIPIVHPRFRRHHALGKTNTEVTRSDMILSPSEWTSRIVGKLSPYLNVDVPCLITRLRYQDSMNEELAYCRGLGLSAIMFNLHGRTSNNLARIILSYFENSHHASMLWVRVPIVSEKKARECAKNDPDNSEENDAPWNETWEWWSKFHEHLEYDKRVGVVLELSADLPPAHLLQRWLGEPVKAIILPTSIFQSNKKGYPVLTSKPHQNFLLQMVARDAQVIVSGARHHNVEHYNTYLTRLWNLRPNQKYDPMLDFALGWEDYVQTPLQPLADNLDTHTYNVFERDPVKYDQYQIAMERALLDLQKNESSYQETEAKEKQSDTIDGKSEQNSEENRQDIGLDQGDTNEDYKKTFTVMILGAGRGPLIRAALNAAVLTKSKIKVVAVEKNPYAVVVLTALVRELWEAQDVHVVSGDMRQIQLTPQADIIVSELLGSWGDNELSPECLDGAMGLLRPDGICIPCSYTSYVAPVCSARLWAAARSIAGATDTQNPDKNLETIWVVYMQNKYDIADVQPVFTFNHPSEGARDHEGEEIKDPRGLPVPDNRRSTTLTWEANQDSVMHGFAGYFDFTLYKDHIVSTVPSKHTDGMISWFPVFIPIKTPLRVHKGETITTTFWRCLDPRRVWYEWIVQVGNRSTSVHNRNGRSSEMLL